MRIAIVNNDDFSVWHFRKGLVKALIARGVEVVIITPGGEYVSKLESLGATHVPVPIFRFVSPLRDLKLCWDLYRVLRKLKPDVVHNMTVKPNTYGAIMARLAGVPERFSLVSGAGYGFSMEGGWKQAIRRWAVRKLYWLGGRCTTRTWFLNQDDHQLFTEGGLLRPEQGVMILSEGVNLGEYSAESVHKDGISKIRADLKIESKSKVVLMMVARLAWSKGVRQFVDAAEQLKRKGISSKFILVGPLDPDAPDPVPEEYLRSHESDSFVWLGFRKDVRELLSIADVITLPSYYREGVPRILLEAMAMAKPIVTTDNVGCRAVVEHGKNGFLVPTENTEALSNALETIVCDDSIAFSFGQSSVDKVRREFEESVIIQRVFRELYGWES